MTEPLDLTQCEDEPIHIPGSIQPHGALLGLSEPDLEVVLESSNAGQVIGETALHGRKLEELIDADAFATLRKALGGDPRNANPLRIDFSGGVKAYGLVHRSDGLLILEVEPVGDEQLQFRTAYQRLIRRFDRLRRAETLDEVCDIAAREIQRLTGFDRTMVYRFDQRANGQVIAEERADENLEPFLGLHYPATDIPPQARKLYIENPIRLIVDAAYEPALLKPDTNPLTGRSLDLSQASLRSISPIHCRYLLNMGVRSSMSISLLSGESLWGLIACHHREPFHVAYGTRLVAEFLAHVLSARVSELERVHALASKNTAYSVQSRLIDEMVAASRFQDGLSGDGATLVDLISCDGAAVLFRGEITLIGQTPDLDAIRELAVAASKQSPSAVLATDRLSEIHPPAADYTDTAAGAIIVPISNQGTDFLFWFRGEEIRTVTWAGDPSKAAVKDAGSSRLLPRSSFEAWAEQVRAQSVPWADWEIEVASDFRTALVASVVHQAAELERMNAKLVNASRQKDKFLATVSHELRNPLNAIMGWVHVAKAGLKGAELTHALDTIERNAQAQTELISDLLDVSQIEGGRLKLETTVLDLAEIVALALESLEPTARGERIELVAELEESSSNIVGDSRRLQQVVWNLVTNAIKFSPPDSRILVRLERRSSLVVLTVRDQGTGIAPELQPHIFDAFRQGKGTERMGLGLGLSIVKSIVELHGGQIQVESKGEGHGSLFTVTLPVAALRPDSKAGPAPTPRFDFSGARILVVEDRPDAAQMIAALLESLDAEAVVAANGVEALEALRNGPVPALVISDLDMPELDGFGLIAAMRAESDLRAVPAIALTAFTRGGDRAKALTAGFKHHVSKPVDPDELLAVVASLLGRLG